MNDQGHQIYTGKKTMSLNSDGIVQNIRAEFESMLQYVQESEEKTADEVERNLFRQLLGLGAQLMLLFFLMRSREYTRPGWTTKEGMRLPYHGKNTRGYYSIFGKLPLSRPYYYKKGVGKCSPLDEGLSLGDDCYSDLMRELAEFLGVDVTYAKVRQFWSRLLGQTLSTQAIQGMVAKDAAEVKAYYQQKEAPDVASEATILVAQADGKGVPMVRETPVAPKRHLGKGEKRGKKKEAIVTSCYTIESHTRTPDEVVASFFHPESSSSSASQQRTGPRNKHVWATLDGKDAALSRLTIQTTNRDGAHILHRVALTDGCEALQSRVETHLPDFTLILDFVHASEYLWDAANALHGEHSPKRDIWAEQQTLQLLSGQTQSVIAELVRLVQKPRWSQAKRKAFTSAANYFQRNQPYMHYKDYLANGWPIASGVIEGACRHLVKDRCELSGMRWTQDGAESLLHLRAVAENDDWDAYHQLRKEQRHLRLYGSPISDRNGPEQQALSQHDSDKIIRFDRIKKQRHTEHLLLAA
jgi:hypothetical protein